MEGCIGEIRLFAGNFNPRNWAFCEGQLIAISQNSSLYAIIGTQYGGDGRSTFALPDLRGRAPRHLPNGHRGGSEAIVLSAQHLPAHSHDVAIGVNTGQGSLSSPNNGVISATAGGFATAPDNTTIGGIEENTFSDSTPLPVRTPYIAMNYIICIWGIFPSQH